MNHKLILGCLIGVLWLQPEQEVIRTSHLVLSPERLPKSVALKKSDEKRSGSSLKTFYYYRDGNMQAIRRMEYVPAELVFSPSIEQSKAYRLELSLEEFDITGLDAPVVYDAVLAQLRLLADFVSQFESEFGVRKSWQFTSRSVQLSSQNAIEIRFSRKSDVGTALTVIYLTSYKNRLLLVSMGDSEDRNEQQLADINKMIDQLRESLIIKQ